MERLTVASDEELMARVTARDPDAFEQLYDRFAPLVLGVIIRIVQDRAEGEEILQETYWRVWSQAATFDPEKGPFRPWLLSIARRQALDLLRRRKVRPQAAQSESEERQFELAASPGTTVPEAAERNLAGAQLRGAIGKLSPEQQEVLEMAYFGGLTRQEIASKTGIPLGTVHTRARLGLQNLRAYLRAADDE